MGTVLKGISDICGINFDIASGGYRCVFSGGGVTVEGVKSVLAFSSESVLLSLKSGKLEIKGSLLKVREYSRGYICISGSVGTLSLV